MNRSSRKEFKANVGQALQRARSAARRSSDHAEGLQPLAALAGRIPRDFEGRVTPDLISHMINEAKAQEEEAAMLAKEARARVAVRSFEYHPHSCSRPLPPARSQIPRVARDTAQRTGAGSGALGAGVSGERSPHSYSAKIRHCQVPWASADLWLIPRSASLPDSANANIEWRLQQNLQSAIERQPESEPELESVEGNSTHGDDSAREKVEKWTKSLYVINETTEERRAAITGWTGGSSADDSVMTSSDHREIEPSKDEQAAQATTEQPEAQQVAEQARKQAEADAAAEQAHQQAEVELSAEATTEQAETLQAEAHATAEQARKQAEAEHSAEATTEQAEAEQAAEQARKQAEADTAAEQARKQAAAEAAAEQARKQAEADAEQAAEQARKQAEADTAAEQARKQAAAEAAVEQARKQAEADTESEQARMKAESEAEAAAEEQRASEARRQRLAEAAQRRQAKAERRAAALQRKAEDERWRVARLAQSEVVPYSTNAFWNNRTTVRVADVPGNPRELWGVFPLNGRPGLSPGFLPQSGAPVAGDAAEEAGESASATAAALLAEVARPSCA